MTSNPSNGGYSINVTGGSVANNADFTFGKNATLTLNNPNEAEGATTFTVTGTLRLGSESASDTGSTLHLTAGTFKTNSWFAVGRKEKGTVIIDGGKLVTGSGNAFILADVESGTGILQISSGTLEIGNTLNIGGAKSTTGTFEVTGGTTTLKNNVSVGNAESSNATLTVNGASAVVEIKGWSTQIGTAKTVPAW